jgi:hypothetical protein
VKRPNYMLNCIPSDGNSHAKFPFSKLAAFWVLAQNFIGWADLSQMPGHRTTPTNP